MKYDRHFISILLLFCMVLSLSACGKSIEQTTMIKNNRDTVYGTSQYSGIPINYQICETGVVYLSMGQARYYDFGAKQSYVLCNRPNCLHINNDCSAYANTGVAYFQNAVYMVRQKEEVYELLQLDLTSGTQKVIASLEIGSYEDGEWVIQDVGSPTYAGNHAWMGITYGHVYMDEKGNSGIERKSAVLLGIDLTTGEIIRLNEVTDKNELIGFEEVSAEYVVFEKNWYETPPLSEVEFQKALENGEYEEYVEEAKNMLISEGISEEHVDKNAYQNAYFFYTLDYPKTHTLRYTAMVYEVATGSITELFDEECITQFNEDGSLSGSWSPYVFEEIVGDMLLYESMYPAIYEEDTDIADIQYAYSFSDKTTTELFAYSNRGSLYCMVDEHVILCRDFMENNQAQLFYYDLESGERTDLFVDDRSMTFQVLGYTKDSYIGIMYEDALMSLPTYFGTLCQISKEDFEIGNLDAAKKIPI